MHSHPAMFSTVCGELLAADLFTFAQSDIVATTNNADALAASLSVRMAHGKPAAQGCAR